MHPRNHGSLGNARIVVSEGTAGPLAQGLRQWPWCHSPLLYNQKVLKLTTLAVASSSVESARSGTTRKSVGGGFVEELEIHPSASSAMESASSAWSTTHVPAQGGRGDPTGRLSAHCVQAGA